MYGESERGIDYSKEADRSNIRSENEYSIGTQLEAWVTEGAMLQDIISQVEKKFGPVLVDDDTVAADRGDRGMDRRMNSPVVETIISNREFLRGQTQRLMNLIERAQI